MRTPASTRHLIFSSWLSRKSWTSILQSQPFLTSQSITLQFGARLGACGIFVRLKKREGPRKYFRRLLTAGHLDLGRPHSVDAVPTPARSGGLNGHVYSSAPWFSAF